MAHLMATKLCSGFVLGPMGQYGTAHFYFVLPGDALEGTSPAKYSYNHFLGQNDILKFIYYFMI
jgi:hypothetical protein